MVTVLNDTNGASNQYSLMDAHIIRHKVSAPSSWWYGTLFDALHPLRMSHKNEGQMFFPIKHVLLLRWCHGWIIWSLLKVTFTFLTQCENITGSYTCRDSTLASLHVRISLFETTVNVNLYLGSTLISLQWQLSHESFSSWITPISWCARLFACHSSDKRANPCAWIVQSVCRVSLCCSSDRHLHPSVGPIRSVCCVSQCCSSDRHAHLSSCSVWLVCRISLCHSSDRPACPSACPVRLVCRISLRCSADWCSCHLCVLAAVLHLLSFSRDFDTAFAAAVLAPALVTAMIQTES